MGRNLMNSIYKLLGVIILALFIFFFCLSTVFGQEEEFVISER